MTPIRRYTRRARTPFGWLEDANPVGYCLDPCQRGTAVGERTHYHEHRRAHQETAAGSAEVVKTRAVYRKLMKVAN